jgi:hypothetical protein
MGVKVEKIGVHVDGIADKVTINLSILQIGPIRKNKLGSNSIPKDEDLPLSMLGMAFLSWAWVGRS